MIIKKKSWPEEFQATLNGSKKFDCRLFDFDCAVGDTLLLEEWDSSTKEYTGRTLEKKITYILKTKEVAFWKEEDVNDKGFQIMSLE
ncbi:MAG: DUF3850 domain-containing protein [Candidatus Falkowbacteria bacterium]|nr:DUF3850 domain-containing protein [Candidatus Falkowbacteria bacterium]